MTGASKCSQGVASSIAAKVEEQDAGAAEAVGAGAGEEGAAADAPADA